MNDQTVLDAEVVGDPEPGQELAPVAQPSPNTLFRTDDPALVLTRAREVADQLKAVLTQQGLITRIGSSEHVRVEGWQTLGTMLGITAVCVDTNKIEDGWEARVEARTLDGRVVGAAEAMCLRLEENWKESDEFAIRSMAQTRATSKALASVLRFVVTLAGFSGTPAEEMVGRGIGKERKGFASDKQRNYFERLLKEADVSSQGVTEIVRFCQEGLPSKRVSKAIDALKEGGETRKKAVAALNAEAQEWASKQSDVPFDDSDLPAAA